VEITESGLAKAIKAKEGSFSDELSTMTVSFCCSTEALVKLIPHDDVMFSMVV